MNFTEAEVEEWLPEAGGREDLGVGASCVRSSVEENGCVTMLMYLMSLDYTLQNAENGPFYGIAVLPQLKNIFPSLNSKISIKLLFFSHF